LQYNMNRRPNQQAAPPRMVQTVSATQIETTTQ